MFNIGWGELLVIAVIVLFAFGPEDIPKIMYNIGKVVRRFRYMRYALSSQFEDFMEKAEAQGRAKGQLPAIPVVDADSEGDADEHLMTMLPKAEEKKAPLEDLVSKSDQTDKGPQA